MMRDGAVGCIRSASPAPVLLAPMCARPCLVCDEAGPALHPWAARPESIIAGPHCVFDPHAKLDGNGGIVEA